MLLQFTLSQGKQGEPWHLEANAGNLPKTEGSFAYCFGKAASYGATAVQLKMGTLNATPTFQLTGEGLQWSLIVNVKPSIGAALPFPLIGGRPFDRCLEEAKKLGIRAEEILVGEPEVVASESLPPASGE